MYILKNGLAYEPMTEYSGKRIIISFDSSRTDTCMTIADEYGERLDDYELCGVSSDDVLEQCKWERQCLSTILAQSDPFIVGIEDIITKKENGKFSNGIEIHQSRFKITAIFMSIIVFFQDAFDLTPELVNNWAWKSTILPEEFRTRDHHKGSLDWYKAQGHKLGLRNDNVTDSDCILKFLIKTHNISSDKVITDAVETCTSKYDIAIMSGNTDLVGSTVFVDNTKLRTEDKIAFMVNRLSINEIGSCMVDVHSLTPTQVYTLCKGRFNRKEERVVICVKRIG